MDDKIKISIVEDHQGFSEALKFYLERKQIYKVVSISKDSSEVQKNLSSIYGSDLVFMDIELSGENGIVIGKDLLNHFPNLKIVAMTMYEDKVYLTQLISAGFKGVLFKTNFYEDLNKTIGNVLNNKLSFPENINF